MTGDEVLHGVGEIAREHLSWQDELSAELDLIEDLELDSLQLLTLAVEVENRFQVCLDQQDEAGIQTVGDLVSVVLQKLKTEAEPEGG